MVNLREGYLSDSNIIKICAEHQPIPMNRLDLLPMPMRDRSGMYYRPLKQPKIISRPETANTMLQATQKLTGRDLTIDYKKAVAKEQKIPIYPDVLPQLSSGEVIPIYGSQSSTGISLANLSYTALLQATQTGAPSVAAIVGAPSAAIVGAPSAAIVGAPSTAIVGAPSTAIVGAPSTSTAIVGAPSVAGPSTAQVLTKAQSQLVRDKLATANKIASGSMKKADLVKELRYYNLSPYGNKGEIQARLEKFVRSPDVPKSKSKTTSSGLSSQITQLAKQKSKEILIPTSKEPVAPGTPEAPEID
jgi:hypothetical protein